VAESTVENQNRKVLTTVKRLARRYEEVIWWGAAVGVVIGLFVIADTTEVIMRDWREYYRPATLSGDYLGYRNTANPTFVVLLFAPLAALPIKVGFLILNLITVITFRLTARLSNINKWLIFPSFPALWMVVYGQIDALVALGVALGWWAIKNKRPYWQGLATILLILKPHVTGLLAICYLFWQKDRRAFVVSISFLLVTLVIFGLWPIKWLTTLFSETGLAVGGQGQNTSVNEWNNIGLYPWGLLLLPLLLVPYAREKKIPALISASLLASPYAGAYTLMAVMGVSLPMLTYPVLSLPLFDQLLFRRGYDLIVIAPLALVLYPVVQRGWSLLTERKRGRPSGTRSR